ncbi:NAD(P)-binding protein [Gonapodya prolifera JEL478]|uniref:NAD(P)-binding protein n=1 Tax=Gonapodya prolifera (strain JEL478) TaxID=1344416 RepID=A0A139AH39_GONPJ|nr:NAD(P)-binding protein [Gonapodya prolifera JEL478]|eukprot:KXS16009.1 NAD(P)-binding protein [Gonapodya prolifera JEL478]
MAATAINGNATPHAVLVTGSSSGFGFGTVFTLAERGFRVYAGCRSAKGRAAVSQEITKRGIKEDRIEVMELDVTNEESVARCAAHVGEMELAGVYAVVSNAGLGETRLLEMTSMETYSHVYETNTLGSVRVFQHFLPLLRKFAELHASGPAPRIVAVSSIGGLVAAAEASAYAASKFALEAVCDSLRRELILFSSPVRVCVVEPAFASTPILEGMKTEETWDAALAGTRENLREDVKKAYRGMFDWQKKKQIVKFHGELGSWTCGTQLNHNHKSRTSNRTRPHPHLAAMDPQYVVDAIVAQVAARNPNHRKIVAPLLDYLLLSVARFVSTRIGDWLLYKIIKWRASVQH